MCVAVPAKIISLEGPTAVVEVGGISRSVSVQLTPDAQKGDYVLVHAGFAIQILDSEEARQTLQLFAEIEDLEGD